MHLIALHDSAGSSNPLGVSGNYDRLPFAPHFIFKDLITIFIFYNIINFCIFYTPCKDSGLIKYSNFIKP